MADSTFSKKPMFNLSLVLKETGLKADTLRAWERRYHLPQPQRSQGGHRLFSEHDIETIKWLVARQNEGLGISRAVALWHEIQNNEQDPLSPLPEPIKIPFTPNKEQQNVNLVDEHNRWIRACLEFDETTAEQVLNKSFAQFSMETVCVEVLQSGLAEIGSLWYQGLVSVQQEHFASELALRRLYTLLQAAPMPTHPKTILAACPHGEMHSFSALLITLLLRYRSWNVIYLGANVPTEEISETIEKTKPDLVVMPAMLLAAAAALLKTAMLLQELGIPLAFGGRIFTHIPALQHRIPGFYLGNELLEAIPTIENLLSKSIPETGFDLEPGLFSETIAHYIDNIHKIETHTLNNLETKLGQAAPLDNIRTANDHLAQDISAALTLGDISLLETNIEWVEQLIVHHHLPASLLVEYLQAYHDAAQTYLDESGLPIIDWLASVIKKE